MKYIIIRGVLFTPLCLFLFALMPVFAEEVSPENLFQTAGGYGCGACHGKYAHGGGFVGGNIRGATREQLDSALKGEPTMLLLAKVLDDNKRNLLVDHLTSLGEMQLIEWRLGESATMQTIKAQVGTVLQLVLFNGTFDTLTLDLSSIEASNNYHISPYDTQAITWLAKAGRYSLFFKNEKIIIEIN
ncbi:hypothetical protein ACLKMH_12640 [Psychromonas sp. KJ10-10]|uniref:hypothetical protein n=1 Tax=Psychromonas sp. KJ10-10 TaxID=3391823 RepID=UPI0039B4BF49